MLLHNHSPEQKAVLVEMLNATISNLLSVSFEVPANDHQLIRHHAYQKGRYDLLVSMLQDNYEAPEPLQPPEE